LLISNLYSVPRNGMHRTRGFLIYIVHPFAPPGKREKYPEDPLSLWERVRVRGIFILPMVPLERHGCTASESGRGTHPPADVDLPDTGSSATDESGCVG
jgi:hypothetical protein